MKDVPRQFELPECCIAAGEREFLKRFPLEFGTQDVLRDQLLAIGKRWGPIAQANTSGVFIRTVSSDISGGDPLPYFTAEMNSLSCPRGHPFSFALLSRRVYYFVWRVHMVCLSFFQESSRAGAGADFSGPADWPGPEQAKHVNLASRMYRDDAFLSNEGFGEIYKWSQETPRNLAFQHVAVSELALLFILFHEVQHAMEAFHEMNPDKPPLVRTGLGIEGLGNKQQKNWGSEMQADCNALFMLIALTATALHEKTSMSKEEAQTAAHSLAAQGADLVLHSLEFVERQTFGKLDVEKARTMLEFLTHPPCDLRRKALSYTSYQIVTGKPYSMLFEGYSTDEWKQIARDCGSQISIRERLFSTAEALR